MSSNAVQLALLPGVEETSTNMKMRDGRGRSKKFRPETPCQLPTCINVVPGGMVASKTKNCFCSKRCERLDYVSKHVIGECEYCHGPILGIRDRSRVVRFCSRACQTLFHNDRMLMPTGPFRALIEEYLAVTTTYAKSTLGSVKPSLAHFFAHAVVKEGITTLEEIGPSVVGRFVAGEKARGMTSSNSVGHIATLFNWLIYQERFDRRNPVIARIHSQRSKPAAARPYTDKDLSFIWDLVEAKGSVALKLAFSIGEECGLRVGEVCNVRLEDIDQVKQTIFVRLPTKGKETRTVPYHDKVARHLAQWLELRDPDCLHDRLIHGKRLGFYTSGSLDERFKVLLGAEAPPATNFSFHRLRHSWATGLMNNGMELAVLKVLGGWKNWNSMQKYIKVLDRTVRSQYEASYRKLQEQPEAGSHETLSLLDFAMLESPNGAPAVPEAA
jgi:integrase